MRRPAVFTAPTRLWNAAEGWREFGVGEGDPGGAWFETEGGPLPAEIQLEGVLAELAASRADIERLQRLIDSQSRDMALMAADRDAAVARVGEMSRTIETLRAGGEASPQPSPFTPPIAPQPIAYATADPGSGPISGDIPANWETMPFLSLRALARRVSGIPDLSGKPACIAAIREHLTPA